MELLPTLRGLSKPLTALPHAAQPRLRHSQDYVLPSAPSPALIVEISRMARIAFIHRLVLLRALQDCAFLPRKASAEEVVIGKCSATSEIDLDLAA